MDNEKIHEELVKANKQLQIANHYLSAITTYMKLQHNRTKPWTSLKQATQSFLGKRPDKKP